MERAKHLSAEAANFALYLPALPPSYIQYAISRSHGNAPAAVRPVDLDFLDAGSRLWTYKWCLASAGHLAYSGTSNTITRRNPDTSWVMGDSGGYQVATGALKDTKGWRVHSHDPARLAELWRGSRITEDLLRWLDTHCDYAMTLDMPLWVKSDRFRSAPFHHCSTELLTDLTVENLRYIDQHRGAVGNCKFLNVLQGRDDAEEDYWYRRVRDFEFEGWALGGSVNWAGGLPRVLRRVLIMRDERMLGGRRQWLHILGNSQLIWAVALTAIQRAVQANTGGPFTASFDSSTPFLWAGKYQMYPKPPQLTRDLRTWYFSSVPFPVGYAAATHDREQPFPSGSPLASLLTIGDLNPKSSPYARNTFGPNSGHLLGNHNTYVFLRGFIDANKVAFGGPGAIPQVISDMVGLIGDLFNSETWLSLLEAEGPSLGKAPKRLAA